MKRSRAGLETGERLGLESQLPAGRANALPEPVRLGSGTRLGSVSVSGPPGSLLGCRSSSRSPGRLLPCPGGPLQSCPDSRAIQSHSEDTPNQPSERAKPIWDGNGWPSPEDFWP